jgi:hypothetical protein
MATPANPNYTEDFILMADRKSEKPTVFHIGVLDTLLRVHIDDEHTTLKRLVSGLKLTDAEVHHKYLEMVRFGLRGWTNFNDASDSPVPFEAEQVDVPKVGKRQAITDSCLGQLDTVDLMEIGMQISKLNSISREQRKN